jgi:beta-glucanase (GH16 family)
MISSINPLILKCHNALLHHKIWWLCLTKSNRLDSSRGTPTRDGWHLTFEDDFDSFDRAIWIDMPYYGLRYHPGSIPQGQAPSQYFDPDLIQVQDSCLHLISEPNPITISHQDQEKDWGSFTIPFRCAWVQTLPHTFSQHEGFFEIRAKAPSQLSCWPAFWLVSTESWPPEIDIFEHYTSKSLSRSTSTIHWGTSPNHPQSGFAYCTLPLDEEFGVWGCEWNSSEIKIYYNRILVHIFKTPSDFTLPMCLVINSAIQTLPDNTPKDPTSRATFIIDWVRVWKKL